MFRTADGTRAEIPGRSGILLVDVQEGFMNASTCRILPRITRLLDAYGDTLSPLIASRYVNREGSPCRILLGWDGVSEEPDTVLRPEVLAYDPIVCEKTTYAIGAPLTERLRDDGVEALLIAGVDTNACVLHEALDAFDRVIRPIVLADLCASGDGEEAHAAALRILEHSIGVHNVWYGSADVPASPPAAGRAAGEGREADPSLRGARAQT